ncbi:hypothetical protein KC906_04870 [Candidatus Kaiserbacteria bacterium]|nr:hypothetical protein [Candidatus Kaiserbacteria bacterium]
MNLLEPEEIDVLVNQARTREPRLDGSMTLTFPNGETEIISKESWATYQAWCSSCPDDDHFYHDGFDELG